MIRIRSITNNEGAKNKNSASSIVVLVVRERDRGNSHIKTKKEIMTKHYKYPEVPSNKKTTIPVYQVSLILLAKFVVERNMKKQAKAKPTPFSLLSFTIKKSHFHQQQQQQQEEAPTNAVTCICQPYSSND